MIHEHLSFCYCKVDAVCLFFNKAFLYVYVFCDLVFKIIHHGWLHSKFNTYQLLSSPLHCNNKFKSVVNCQEHPSLVCSRLCPPWRVHECVNCAVFTHATNVDQHGDDQVLVNSSLLVCLSISCYSNRRNYIHSPICVVVCIFSH